MINRLEKKPKRSSLTYQNLLLIVALIPLDRNLRHQVYYLLILHELVIRIRVENLFRHYSQFEGHFYLSQ